jgi:peptidyl-prolyl cis-trans isomerase C
MKYYRILLLAGALALAACQKTDTAATSTANAPTAENPAVATVNGQPITKSFFDFYLRGVTGKEPNELSAEQREQALDNLIRAKVIAAKAEADGVAKAHDTAALIELQRLNVLQNAASEKYLEDKKATDQELRSEYETQVAALPRLEYHARHILVATEDFAKKLVAQLEKGAKFEDLAKRESMDGSKDQGGDLQWFTPDRMVKPFADAVVALKPGEYTHTPVQTQFGWHIIKLEETRDLQAPAFDQVKQRLEQMVQAKKFKAYGDELMKTAKVEKPAAAPAAAEKPKT